MPRALYPYRWTSATQYENRFYQSCAIREYLEHGFVVVVFDDGFSARVPRTMVRLREQYKREEVRPRG